MDLARSGLLGDSARLDFKVMNDYQDLAADFVCQDCGTELNPAEPKAAPPPSIWTLRLGVALALLPIPAFGITLLYSISIYRHAKLIPEDVWPVAYATVAFTWFAGACLVPSPFLLLRHLRSNRLARWAFGISLVQILALGGGIVYTFAAG